MFVREVFVYSFTPVEKMAEVDSNPGRCDRPEALLSCCCFTPLVTVGHHHSVQNLEHNWTATSHGWFLRGDVHSSHRPLSAELHAGLCEHTEKKDINLALGELRESDK